MTPLDAVERERLCDLFVALGPDAPTLCEGWTTFDLAAHLVVRERDPRSGPGLLLGGRFAQYTERLMARQKERGFDTLVTTIRSGPPWLPWRVPALRTFVNLQEYFVHHEDVRRANGMSRRDDIPEIEAAIWKVMQRAARLAVRRVAVGVELALPNGERVVAKRAEPSATVIGEPGELALFLTGRKDHALVSFSGEDAAVAAVRASQFGI